MLLLLSITNVLFPFVFDAGAHEPQARVGALEERDKRGACWGRDYLLKVELGRWSLPFLSLGYCLSQIVILGSHIAG